MTHTTIMGRITKDLELRHTQSGVPVLSFSVAVNHRIKSGEEQKADFFDVVAWRGTAEFVSKHFGKGRMIAVQGRMESRDWTDKSGNSRRSWELQADQVYFTGEKKDDNGRGCGYSPAKGYPDVDGTDFAEMDDDDGELPF